MSSVPVTISYKRRRCARYLLDYDETSQESDGHDNDHDDEWNCDSLAHHRQSDDSSQLSFSCSSNSSSPQRSAMDITSQHIDHPINTQVPKSSSASQLDPLGVYYDPSLAAQQQAQCKHCPRLFRLTALVDYIRHLRSVHSVQPPNEQLQSQPQPQLSEPNGQLQSQPQPHSQPQPSEPNKPDPNKLIPPVARRGRPKRDDTFNKSILVCRICLDYRFSDEELSDHLRQEHLSTGLI